MFVQLDRAYTQTYALIQAMKKKFPTLLSNTLASLHDGLLAEIG
jgi:hypothetical protein